MNNMNLDNIFDELSFFCEAGIDNFNVEKLKEIGNVIHIKKEKDGIITEIIEFETFDKSLSFSKQFSYYHDQERRMRLEQIKEEIAAAVANEDYELAQKLKEEKDSL